MKYLSIDDIETSTIVNKAKIILNEWIALTMTQTNKINQQQAFQEFFNQVYSLFHLVNSQESTPITILDRCRSS
jgi:hypothetical protein